MRGRQYARCVDEGDLLEDGRVELAALESVEERHPELLERSEWFVRVNRHRIACTMSESITQITTRRNAVRSPVSIGGDRKSMHGQCLV